MPDALEAARALDAEFARTGRLQRAAARHSVRHQGSVRYLRHAHDQRCGGELRQRPAAARRRGGGAAAQGRRDHPRQGQHGRIRLRRPQHLRRHHLQSLRHQPQRRPLERRLGRGGRGQSGDVRASARRPGRRRAIPPPTTAWSASSRPTAWSAAPASCRHRFTRDRAGVLCRTVKDAATVLSALAGYDPRDAATAASVGQIPSQPVSGVCREREPAGRAHRRRARVHAAVHQGGRGQSSASPTRRSRTCQGGRHDRRSRPGRRAVQGRDRRDAPGPRRAG